MDKQELEKMIEKLEKINLYLSSQMEWNLQCITKDLKFTPINPKDVSDAINLQKVMLNNNDLIDKYKKQIDVAQMLGNLTCVVNESVQDVLDLDNSLVDLKKIEPPHIHKYWERLYLDNNKKLIIKTTDSIRGIGKTSFLVEMCKKYDGVFVVKNSKELFRIKEKYGLENTVLYKDISMGVLCSSRLHVFDEGMENFMDIRPLKSLAKTLEENKKFTNYIMIKRVD